MSLVDLLFWIFGITASASAVMVVATQNVVRMAFWLMLALASVASLFFLLGADFAGTAQLLIYVGGTVVLLVFGVMLTASGHYQKILSSPAELFLGAGVGLSLFFVLSSTLMAVDWPKVVERQTGANSASFTENVVARKLPGTTRPLGAAFLGLRGDRGLTASNTAQSYFLPFEIVSVHLLVVLVGAAYLARAKRRRADVEN